MKIIPEEWWIKFEEFEKKHERIFKPILRIINTVIPLVKAAIPLVIAGYILAHYFPSSPISIFLFGYQPDAVKDIGCKLITSNIAKNEDFSVDKSKDYYADIYSFENLDPLTYAVLQVDLTLPNDISIAGFQSFPYSGIETIYGVDNSGVETTLTITTHWNNSPPYTINKLMIFYNTTQKVSKFLKNEDKARKYSYTIYNVNSKNEKYKGEISKCDDFDFFYNQSYR